MYNQLLGRFSIQSAIVKHTETHYTPPRVLADKVDAVWNRAKEKYGDNLWNGINYRLNTLKIENDSPVFYLGTADYKVNYSAKDLAEDIMLLPFNDRPKCMYVSTLLQTTDERFVLGQTAATGVHGTTLALLGGILNQNEMAINSGSELESYLYKELNEEMEITEEMVVSSQGLGVYEMPTCRIGIFFTTQLSIPSDEFRKLVRINDEHDGYVIVTREEILSENENPNTYINRGVFLALSLLEVPHNYK